MNLLSSLVSALILLTFSHAVFSETPDRQFVLERKVVSKGPE
jgi:hypothetical protein